MPEDFLANLSVERRKTQWQQWLEQNVQVMMVCEVNHQIIGFASAGQPRDQDLSSDTAELYTLYLLSDFWSKGFGKQLYLATLNQLKAGGYKQLALWVLDSNQ